jgi:hypothetical protein
MSNVTESVIKSARAFCNEGLYGDVDYYIQIVGEFRRQLRLVCDIAEQLDLDLSAANTRTEELITKLIGKL